MDTVEELNGTYFYKGISNISAGELYLWILLDEIGEHFGSINDLAGMVLILIGQPNLRVRAKMEGATPGISIASAYARKYLDIELKFRLPTFTNASIRTLKPMYVNHLGGFVGRTVPVLGWALVASDVALIVFRATSHYNKVARKGDKIW